MEEFRRLTGRWRRALAAEDVSIVDLAAIENTCMAPEHDPLNAELEQ
jgi:hypothetical protein